jgi:hypothetical protein
VTLFTNIQRSFLDGEKIEIEGEANYTPEAFLEFARHCYAGWTISTQLDAHEECAITGLERPFHFSATKITLLARCVLRSLS